MSKNGTSEVAHDSKDWFMYHGAYGHGGTAQSKLTKELVGDSSQFGLLKSIPIEGSILSVPAIVGGSIYVGLANSREAVGSNGGTIKKVDVNTGKSQGEFTWSIDVSQRDVHGFTGMGCTPTVVNGFVYFVGFDAILYCLNADTMEKVWSTDLRHPDETKNQPIINVGGKVGEEQGVPAEGWSSPLVINNNGVPKVILGIGEGENPYLMSFVFCLDATSGKVDWVYCTCQFEGVGITEGNPVNHIPTESLVPGAPLPKPFVEYTGKVAVQGTSIWSAIAYDEETGLLYAGTGQPASPSDVGAAPGHGIDKGLENNGSPGWTSGILALDAATGEFHAFTQMPAETSYRPTDFDVDIGSAATVFTDSSGKKMVGIGCKNGGFMICDATTLEVQKSRSLLPYYNDNLSTLQEHWEQIPTVDPHPKLNSDGSRDLNPPYGDPPTNEISNTHWGEGFSGPFNTAAVDPNTGTIFVALGGPNYHDASPGIDTPNTPFMRAIDWETLEDTWPMSTADAQNPRRYTNVGDSMYTTAGESGLSSPAVTNDVVFVSTSKVALYAFDVNDGTLLFSNLMGYQTGGMNGGYGYCLGPAIYDTFVVAGALISGDDGGVLNIYGPLSLKGNY